MFSSQKVRQKSRKLPKRDSSLSGLVAVHTIVETRTRDRTQLYIKTPTIVSAFATHVPPLYRIYAHILSEPNMSTDSDVVQRPAAEVAPPAKRKVAPVPFKNYRVYGFLVNDDAFLEYALKHRLGNDKNEFEKATAIGNALSLVVRTQGIYPYLIAGVYYDNEVRTCVAIASEELQDRMPTAQKETIEKLQDMFNTKRSPRWYTHV
ncbi:hypothetical protein FB451DRAFT_510716 [Mycena latifolia]|nr:hypothetical protein FB451DRAFT_510716 [Mycena latifolia]